jgi:hyperosmotically inducible periplasmic protein
VSDITYAVIKVALSASSAYAFFRANGTQLAKQKQSMIAYFVFGQSPTHTGMPPTYTGDSVILLLVKRFEGDIAMSPPHVTLKLFALVLSAATLMACSKTDETFGQKVDGAVTQTKDAAKQATTEATAAVEKSMEKTAAAASENKVKAAEAFDDAAITTSIVASIAKDPDLSALKIDVSTKNGNVSIHGSAPTEQARARAVAIAQSVKGVINVDNQLSIKPKS